MTPWAWWWRGLHAVLGPAGTVALLHAVGFAMTVYGIVVIVLAPLTGGGAVTVFFGVMASTAVTLRLSVEVARVGPLVVPTP